MTTQTQPKVATTQPVSGVTKPKTLEDWRALFHDAVPIIVTTLIGMSIVTENDANLWIPYLFAIVDPLLSIGATQDKVRRIIYGLVTLLQGSSAAVAVFTDNPQIPILVTAGATIFGSLFARFNTATSALVPKTRNGPDLNDVVP